MDIGFTEEQELLRDTARKFLDGECPTKFVRQMMATEAAVTGEFSQTLAEQGWLGITYDEADGGTGLALVGLFVLMEEIGRAVMAAPHPPTGRRRACPGGGETRKLCEGGFDNVVLPATGLLGEGHEGWPAGAGVIARAAVALCAEICGAAQRVVDTRVESAKLRTAFGKPIGSYQ